MTDEVVAVHVQERVDPLKGASRLEHGVTPIEIWQSLHTNAQIWLDAPANKMTDADRALVDGSDIGLLRALQDYPSEKWSAMCEAVGWTVYGAVALSWCKGVALEDVLAAWKKSGAEITPESASRRPARMINPTLLPETEGLREVVASVEGDALSVAILLAAKREPLVLDLKPSALASAHPMIAGFLLSDYRELIPDGDEKLLLAWEKTVEESKE